MCNCSHRLCVGVRYSQLTEIELIQTKESALPIFLSLFLSRCGLSVYSPRRVFFFGCSVLHSNVERNSHGLNCVSDVLKRDELMKFNSYTRTNHNNDGNK